MTTSSAQSLEARLKDAAFSLMAEEGLAGLDERAICVRARAPEAALRERWPDAWAVFLEAFDERARLPVLPDTGSLPEDLFAYVRDYMAFCSDRAFVGVLFHLMAQASTNDAVREKVGPGFVDRRKRNLIVVRRAIARGELPADVDGNAILDAMLTLGLSYLGRGAPPADDEIRRAVEQIIAEAKASAGRPRRSRAAPGAANAYRLFMIAPSSGAQGPQLAEPEALQARSEGEAVAQVNARRRGRYAELWKAGRLIRVFDAD